MPSHVVTLPPVAYDAMVRRLGMLSVGLFEREVAEGDWVQLRCEDDDRQFVARVTGVAAVIEKVTT